MGGFFGISEKWGLKGFSPKNEKKPPPPPNLILMQPT